MGKINRKQEKANADRQKAINALVKRAVISQVQSDVDHYNQAFVAKYNEVLKNQKESK